MKKRGIPPKRKRFAQEYIIDLNKTQAAIRAGYSKKTAYCQGQRLSKNVEVKKYIEKLIKARTERTKITQDKVLREMYHLGFSNIKNYIQASTAGFISFKDMDKISEEDARAIEVIKVNLKQGTIEFKLHSKTKTIEMMGRHLGMFIDKVQQVGNVPIRLVSVAPRPGDKIKKRKK